MTSTTDHRITPNPTPLSTLITSTTDHRISPDPTPLSRNALPIRLLHKKHTPLPKCSHFLPSSFTPPFFEHDLIFSKNCSI
jgi:hypothetical protein